jgi:Ni/Fe-hydrogenase subunit HybB-like protein
MHFSICLFLGLWFVAQFVWTFPYQQTAGVWIADIIWFIGYASFGYFLYSLYYHFFRKEHEPFVLILVAIVIAIALVLILDIIVSILRLLSAQPVDFSILLFTLVYPILDAALIFPAVLIFWGVRKRITAQKNVAVQQEQKTEEMTQREADGSLSLPHSLTNTSSIWILLLSIAMMLSAIGDTGFAFSTASGPDSLQRDVWIWNVIYNADHLCLAAALIGYESFFSFRKQDRKSDSKRFET